MLLAGDISPFHNTFMPADVDADGEVSFYDALAVVAELRAGGARALSAPTGAAGEGEGEAPMFVDVNGDSFLSTEDVLSVVQQLRGEGLPGDQVIFSFQPVSARAAEDFNTTAGDFVEVGFTANNPGDPITILMNAGGAGAPTIFTSGTTVNITLNDATAQDLVNLINSHGPTSALISAEIEEGNAATVLRTTADAFTVVQLRTPITQVEQGDEFFVNLSVQDTRPQPAPPFPAEDRGVLVFVLDVMFDNQRILVNEPLDPSPPPIFQDPDAFNGYIITTPNSGGPNNATGIIDDLGALTINVQGDTERLVLSYRFIADALRPTDDNFSVQDDAAAPVLLAEDGGTPTPFVLDVLANDNLFINTNPSGGTAGIMGQAQLDPGDSSSQVLLEPAGAVEANVGDIDYGQTSITVTGGTLTLETVQGTTAQGGTASISDNGTPLDPTDDVVHYTPAANFFGVDTFTYTVSDGFADGITKTAVAAVTISEVNDPPTPIDDGGAFFTTDEDVPVTFDLPSVLTQLLSNDVPGPTGVPAPLDESGQTLSLINFNGVDVLATPTFMTTGTAGGTITVTDNGAPGPSIDDTVVYQPFAQFSGIERFTYLIVDDGTTNGAADPQPSTITGTISITVNGLNDPPTADDETITTAEDTATTVAVATLLTGDTAGPSPSEDGQMLTFSLVGAASAQGGTILESGGVVTYTPPADFNTPDTGLVDTFTYTIVDDGLPNLTATGTVTVTVTEVNDAPVAVDDGGPFFTTAEGVNVTFDLPSVLTQVLSNDTPGAANEGGQTLALINFNGVDVLATPSFMTTGSDGGTITVTDNGPPGPSLDDTVVYTPSAEFAGIETFTYLIIDDGTTNGAADPQPSTMSGTISITVTEINDQPTADDETITTAEDTATTVSVATLLTGDTAGPSPSEDGQTLTFALIGAASAQGGTISESGGVVTYTPPADFNTPETGLVDTFTYTIVDDGTTNGAADPQTATGTVTVTVTEVNDLPTADDETITTAEETAATVTVATLLTGDTTGPSPTEDGQTLTFALVGAASAQGGTISESGGVVTYTPPAEFNTPDTGLVDTFTYTIVDDGTTNGAADPQTATGTVTVTVTEVNDQPTADDETITTAEDTATTVTVTTLLTGDTAGPSPTEDGQTLTFALVGAASAQGGTISESGGVVTYTPPAEFNTPDTGLVDTFTYTIVDDGTTNGAADPQSATGTVTVTVTEVNDQPTADDETITTAEDAATTVTVATLLAGDTAGPSPTEDGQTLTFGLNGATSAQGGTISESGGVVTYTPPAEFNTPDTGLVDTFTYTIVDDGTTNGAADSQTATGTVTVTVTEMNDLPTADDETITTAEDTATTVTVATLLTGDTTGPAPTEDGQTLTFALVGAASAQGGMISESGGVVTYTPPAEFNTPDTGLVDTFTYTIVDDGTTNGAADPQTATGTVTVTVTEVNDLPTADDETITTAEDTATTVTVATLLTGDTTGPSPTEDGQALTFALVGAASAQGGTISESGGVVTYTPPAEFNTPDTGLVDTFTYTIVDDGTTNGAADPQTATGTVTVTVTEVNDQPTADDETITTAEDTSTTVTVATLLTGDTAGPSPTEDGQTLTFALVGAASAQGGTISESGGIVTYTPSADFNTPDSGLVDTFTYTIVDDGTTNGAAAPQTATGTVTVTVTSVNDEPTFAGLDNIIYLQGTGPQLLDPELNADILDVDGTTLTEVDVTIANFVDGEEALSIAPTAGIDATIVGNGGTIQLRATGGGTATLAEFRNALRNIRYQSFVLPPTLVPNAREVQITANDGQAQNFLGMTTVFVQVVPPQLPFGVNDGFEVDEDSGTTGLNALDNDLFSDDTVNRTITAVTQPPAGEGTVAINGTQIDYTTDAHFFGVTTFTYTIDDDDPNTNDGPSTGTVTLTVNAVNDAPTLNPIGDIAFDEDEPNAALRTVNLTGIDDGPLENQSLTVTVSSSNPTLVPNNPANLTLNYNSPDADGTLVITAAANRPAGSMADTAVITVVVTDNGGTANGGVNSTTQSFTVTVNPVNDPPTIDQVADETVSEDAGAQNITLANITAGPLESQDLEVTATTTVNAALVPDPSITYTSPNSTANLAYTPTANASGVATVEVVVRDAGLNGTLGDGDDGLTTMSFDITVNAVNDEPTLDLIDDPAALFEDAGLQMVGLDGIGFGGGESAGTLTVSAVSSNPGLIPNPTVSYTSPDAMGSLSYTPVADQNGTAVITVTVMDDGGTALGGDDTIERSFTVTVVAVNDAPTLNAISDPLAINEDASQQTVDLDGITAGPNENDNLTVTAVSDNPGLIPNPTVVYTPNGSMGSLNYTPVGDQSGVATITVTVMDDGGTANGGVDMVTRTFNVTVNAVNDDPTINQIANQTVAEDSGLHTVDLEGIAAGGGESQPLSITATSNNQALIPDGNLSVNYASPGAMGTLDFTADAHQNGIAVITLLIEDGGLDENLNLAGDNATITTSFTVTVTEVNDAPIANDIDLGTGPAEDNAFTFSASLLTANDDAGPAGANDELAGQLLTVTGAGGATNGSLAINNNGTPLDPADDTVTYTPTANFNGVDTFVYTITDNGTTNGAADPLTATATATITVSEVNDAPTIANNVSRTTNEDTSLLILPADLLTDSGAAPGPLAPAGTADDESGQMLSIGLPSLTSTNGATLAQGAGGQIFYQPPMDFFGTDTFTYSIIDDGQTDGAADPQTTTGTITVTVESVNDAPNAFERLGLIGIKNGGGQVFAPLDGPMPDNPGPLNEVGQTLTLTNVTVNTAGAGTATVNPDGRTFTFTPAVDFEGIANFTYTVQDDGGTDRGGVDERNGTVTVDVKAFVPTTFSGFVYTDINNNGAKDADETGIANVTVTLSGQEMFGSQLGDVVFLQFTTMADGHYQFNDLKPGTYDVSIETLAGLTDGAEIIHTPGTGAAAPGFNQFSVTHAGVDKVRAHIELLGGHNLQADFTNLGLQAQFFSLADFLASDGGFNAYFGVGADGTAAWSSFGLGWDGFMTAMFEFTSPARDQARLTVRRNDGTVLPPVMLNSTNFTIKGAAADGTTIIKLHGGASAFGFVAAADPVAALPQDSETALEETATQDELSAEGEMLAAAGPTQLPAVQDVGVFAPPSLVELLTAMLAPSDASGASMPAVAPMADEPALADVASIRAQQIADEMADSSNGAEAGEFIEALDALFGAGWEDLA